MLFRSISPSLLISLALNRKASHTKPRLFITTKPLYSQTFTMSLDAHSSKVQLSTSEIVMPASNDDYQLETITTRSRPGLLKGVLHCR